MNRRKILPAVVFLGLALLPFLWLRGPAFHFGESHGFINPPVVLDRYLDAWSGLAGFGEPAAPWNLGVLFPAGLLLGGLEGAGLPPALAQKVYLSLYLVAFFTAWWVFLSLATRDPFARLAGVLSVFLSFYFTAGLFYHERMFALLAAPSLFYLFARHLQTGRPRYAWRHFLVLLLTLAMFFNAFQAASALLAYPLALFFVMVHPGPPAASPRLWARRVLGFFLPALPVYLFVGLLYRFSLFENLERFKTIGTFNFVGSRWTLLFQGRGPWWESQSFEGVKYNLLEAHYSRVVMVAAAFLLLLAALAPFLLPEKKDRATPRVARFFLAVYLGSLAVAGGFAFAPGIWTSLVKQPGSLFAAFREPWPKFMIWIHLGLASLLALAVARVNRRFFTVAVLVLLFLRGAPFFTDHLIDTQNLRWKRPSIILPDHWKEFDRWARGNPRKTVLPHPLAEIGIPYEWREGDEGEAGYPPFRLLGRPNFARSHRQSVNGAPYDGLCRRYDDVVEAFLHKRDPAFMRLGPVDYLLDQRDLDAGAYRFYSREEAGMRRYFEPEPERSFGGKLFLYRARQTCRLPFAYAADRAVKVQSGPAGLSPFIPPPDRPFRSALYLDVPKRQGNAEPIEQRLTPPRRVEAERLSDTLWRVRVGEARGPYLLVFNQTYHRGWEVFRESGRGRIFPRPVAVGTHSLVNGWANSWRVDPGEAGGEDHVLRIEYTPRRLFTLAWVLMAVTALLALGSFLRPLFPGVRRRRSSR